MQYINFNVCTINVGDVMRLKDLREDKDLYQKDVAKLLNTTQQVYSEYELGIRYMPIDKLIVLAKFYNTSIDYIVGLTNEIRPYKRNKKTDK